MFSSVCETDGFSAIGSEELEKVNGGDPVIGFVIGLAIGLAIGVTLGHPAGNRK